MATRSAVNVPGSIRVLAILVIAAGVVVVAGVGPGSWVDGSVAPPATARTAGGQREESPADQEQHDPQAGCHRRPPDDTTDANSDARRNEAVITVVRLGSSGASSA